MSDKGLPTEFIYCIEDILVFLGADDELMNVTKSILAGDFSENNLDKIKGCGAILEGKLIQRLHSQHSYTATTIQSI